jgi:hypothetical protein
LGCAKLEGGADLIGFILDDRVRAEHEARSAHELAQLAASFIGFFGASVAYRDGGNLNRRARAGRHAAQPST